MSPHQPVRSSRAQLVKALPKDDWEVVRQGGRSVRLKTTGRREALVVQLHRELRRGILRAADLGADDLRRLLD